jgi:roadblock/LC7 domain-containing protein
VVYTSSGHLLFVRQGTLFAQKFDPVRLTLAGSPAAIAEHLLVHYPGVAALSASAAGPIVYRTGPSGAQQQFVWFDRSGKALETVAGSYISSGPTAALSPDERRVALEAAASSSTDLWLLDLERGLPTKFTFDPAFDLYPVWSPDGNRIAFSSNRGKDGFDLYVKSATGTGSEDFLLGGEGGQIAEDWSPDGRFLLYKNVVANNADLWALPMGGDQKPIPVAQTAFTEASGRFSPDGKWVAYQSNESGRFEIWVQPFPGPGIKVQISARGGVQARWRHDGTELFYLAPDDRLMAAAIRFDAQAKTVEVSPTVSLFAAHLKAGSQYPSARFYMVSRDGQRFLIATPKEVTLPITVILNWKPKP